MVECATRDVVCLHLAARGDAPEGEPAPPALTAAGIGDALELGETSAGRVQVLEALADLEAAGLVAAEERPVEGRETPRTVYRLTPEGREHASAVRERVRDGEVEVVAADGTTETVPLSAVGRYLGGDSPLVTALARLTDDDRVPLENHATGEFVDRREPLEAVTESIARSVTRASRTVVVRGGPGMGKTALVDEAVEAAAADEPDLVVARGVCQPGPTDPYGPLRRAFAEVPGVDGPADRLDDAGPAGPPEQVATRREALFEAVADDLRAAATERPVVLFLDNLQWAGDATLALFAHLAASVTEWVYPVAFVTTLRPPAEAADPVRDALDRVEAAAAFRAVALEPFGTDETRALLGAVLGSRRLPEAFVDLVQEQTGGVPLYVRETATHLLEAGDVDPSRDRYPTTPGEFDVPAAMGEQVDERLAGLDDAGRELLSLGAVLGEHVPGDVLAAASDLPAPTRREHVDLLVASHVWERVGDGTDGGPADLRFVSAGVREAVVERLSDDRRRALHRRVAEAWLDRGDDDARAARVAHHFEQAGDHERAAAQYRRAGAYAASTYAHDEAVANYERALSAAEDAEDDAAADRAAILADLADVHETVGEYGAADDAVEAGFALAGERSRERCRLLAVRASALLSRGEYEAARETARRQHELAEAVGDTALAARGLRLLGRAARAQGDYERARERAAASLERAREVGDSAGEAASLTTLGAVARDRGDYGRASERFERSLEVARELDDRLREAAALDSLGEVARRQGDYEAAREHHERGLELRSDLGDRRGEAESLNNLGTVAFYQGDREDAREYYERGVAVAEEVGDRQLVADGHNNLGMVAAEAGDHGAARDHFERSLETKRDLGDRRGEAATLNNLATNRFLVGDHEAARAFHERSLDILRDLGDKQGVADCLNNLGLVNRELGDLAAAREHHERSLAIKRDIGDRQGEANCLNNLGIVARKQGDLVASRACLQVALAVYRDLDDESGAAGALHNLGDTALRTAAYDRARTCLRRALDVHERTGGQDEANDRFSLGVVAMRQAEFGDAAEHLERATALYRDAGDATEEARSLEARGELARRRGRPADADDRFGRAADLYREADDATGRATALCGHARVALDRDDLAAALEHDERARDLRDADERSVDAARVDLTASRVALADGDRERARELAERARETFAEGGAEHWAARARARVGEAVAGTAAAREHWEAALATFEAVDATHDALSTLALLVEAAADDAVAVGDDPAERWCERARALLSSAPQAVADSHREWVRRHCGT